MSKRLQKGENISLANFDEVIVGIKAIKKFNDNQKITIDRGVFLLNKNNKITNHFDFIFHNQHVSRNNAIILKKELFKITLKKIPNNIIKIPFILTINQTAQQQQNFSLFRIIVKLFNFFDKKEFASYIIDDATIETAMVVASLYQHKQEWKFRTVGQGYSAGLETLARKFGVKIISKNIADNTKLSPVKNNPKYDGSIIDVTGKTQKIKYPENKHESEFINKRKKIDLESKKIEHVSQNHDETVTLLSDFFKDDFEENEDDESIIESEELSYVGLDNIQKQVLKLFSENNLKILQLEIEMFVKSQGRFKNQLINSINEVCFEKIDDILIEEDGELYIINEYYYKKVLEIC
jgi:stress response protein SCP2